MQVGEAEAGRIARDFAKSAEAPFSALQVLQSFGNRADASLSSRLLDMIESILEKDDAITEIGDGDSDERLFISTDKFMLGKEFCISPEEWEIEASAMVPGDRFLPFIPDGVESDSVKILADGRQIETKSLSIQKSLIAKTFWSEQFSSGNESDTGRRRARSGSSPAKAKSGKTKLQVFDMKDFYSRHSFSKADSLRFTIIDFRNAVFSVKLVSATDRQSRLIEVRRWVDEMDEALKKQIDLRGDYLSAFELITLVCASNPSLFENPMISLAEFLRISQNYEIRKNRDSVPVFALRDSIAEDEIDSSSSPLSISSAEIGSMDSILSRLGLESGASGFTAFVLDALFRGETDLDKVIERVFGSEPLQFSDDGERSAFLNCVEEIWEEATESYDRKADGKSGQIRNEALKLISADISRSVEMSGGDLGEIESALIFHADILANIIARLNSYKKLSVEQINSISRELDCSAESIRSIMSKINSGSNSNQGSI